MENYSRLINHTKSQGLLLKLHIHIRTQKQSRFEHYTQRVKFGLITLTIKSCYRVVASLAHKNYRIKNSTERATMVWNENIVGWCQSNIKPWEPQLKWWKEKFWESENVWILELNPLMWESLSQCIICITNAVILKQRPNYMKARTFPNCSIHISQIWWQFSSIKTHHDMVLQTIIFVKKNSIKSKD